MGGKGYYSRNLHFDAVVKCVSPSGTRAFGAHRAVLCACSPVIARYLRRCEIFTIEGLRAEVVLSILDFMYYREANVSPGNWSQFIKAGRKLQVAGLASWSNKEMNYVYRELGIRKPLKSENVKDPENKMDPKGVKLENDIDKPPLDPKGIKLEDDEDIPPLDPKGIKLEDDEEKPPLDPEGVKEVKNDNVDKPPLPNDVVTGEKIRLVSDLSMELAKIRDALKHVTPITDEYHRLHQALSKARLAFEKAARDLSPKPIAHSLVNKKCKPLECTATIRRIDNRILKKMKDSAKAIANQSKNERTDTQVVEKAIKTENIGSDEEK